MRIAGHKTLEVEPRARNDDKERDREAPVAAAKIRIPASAPRALIREQLLDLLDDHLNGAQAGSSVLLVTAPAGAGKTTTLAMWAGRLAQRANTSVAWVGLDGGDNNAFLLWSAILRALERSGAWQQGNAPNNLKLRSRRGVLSGASISAIIAAFECLAKPVFLVLDDVHEVTAPSALRSLNILLRHLPTTLRVVMASRFPPPLILPRLRLEGRLREIGPEDLIFTRSEARLLLESEGIDLTGPELDLLMAKTEGWAAGVRLAAMTIANSGEPAGLLAGFTGDQRAVADYLAGEVLARQTEQVQQLLLHTSVCPSFTVELAAALSSQENAGEILDQLERTNVLIRHRGRSRRWYRCHPLLRGFLRAELTRRQPSAKRRLHRVAADWFQASGDPLLALEHGIAAADDELVVRLVTTFGLQQLLDGRAHRMQRVLDTAPPRMLGHPAVALVAAAIALDLGDLPTADRCLHRMNSVGQPIRTRRLRALNAVVTLYRARLDGDLRPALAALNTTWAGDTGDIDVDMLVRMNRGTAAAWTGQHSRAKTDLRWALHFATVEQRDAATLHCLTHLAGITAAEGDLVGMSLQASSALDFARVRAWSNTSRCAYLYALLGAEAYQRLDTERAERLSRVAGELVAHRTDPTIELFALILRATVAFDTAQDPHQVVATIRGHWQRLRGRQISPALIAFTAPTEQRMALRVGEYPWAVDVLDRVDNLLVPSGEHALLRANLQAHKGKFNSARRLLAPVIDHQISTLAALTTIDAWLLEAQLAARSEDSRRAHEALLNALAMAEPRQALRPFVEAGPHTRDLLAQETGRYGRLESFANTVIGHLPTSPSGPTDALTDRELTLLAELPSMHTAEEIAELLFVSVNTIKTHLRSIYRKLGVNHRRDAIAAARIHGLL
jgi:LuxR family maltose regulon positive regulatory protein